MTSATVRPPTRHRRRRRAFALLVTLLLILVVSLTVGVLIHRQGVAQAAVRRQVAGYFDRHRDAGLQEMIDRWLATTRGAIPDRLGGDGLAFRLEMPAGASAKFYFFDGQGAALSSIDSLGGEERRRARLILQHLESLGITPSDPAAQTSQPERSSDDRDAPSAYFRSGGPLRVSVFSAPVEVLDAVARSIIPDDNWERFSRELATRRDATPRITQADVRTIATGVGIDSKDAARLDALLTADPTVWRVELDFDPGPGKAPLRGRGLIEITPSGSGTAQFTTRFLSWERRSLADQPEP